MKYINAEKGTHFQAKCIHADNQKYIAIFAHQKQFRKSWTSLNAHFGKKGYVALA